MALNGQNFNMANQDEAFDRQMAQDLDHGLDGGANAGPPMMTETQTMMHMMQQQMASMNTMFQAMIAAQAPAAAAVTAASSDRGHSSPKDRMFALDERYFRRLDKFNNKAEDLKE